MTWPRRAIAFALLLGVPLAGCGRSHEERYADYMASANAYASKGQHYEAVLQYQNAIRNDPASGEAFLKLGDAYMALGRGAAALSSFMRTADLMPRHVGAHLKAANLQLIDGQFTKALSVEPDSIEAQLSAGRYYWMTGSLARAETHFRQALALDPKGIRTNRVMASFYLASRRLGEAEGPLKTVAATADVSRSRIALADYYVLANRVPDARRILTALAANTSTMVAAATRNSRDCSSWRGGAALRSATRSVRSRSNRTWWKRVWHSRVSLGWVYYKKGLLPLAIDMLQNSVKVDPSNPTYHYHLGLAYAQRGESRAARQSLHQALNLKTSFDGARHAADVLRELPN